MALDQYQHCPCGSGKKVKFCCSKDIRGELEKVIRALGGEQRVAALEQIDRLIEDKGARASLLALKADAQLGLDQPQEAAKTVAQFQKLAPYNPVALALDAILAARDQRTEAAVEKLQRALEYIDRMLPSTVYAAIGFVAQALAAEGNVLAARGHLLMQAGMAGDRDRNPVEMLTQINTAREIPLLLKEDHPYAACPDGVAWSGEFNAALKSARGGAWLAACESLASLAQKVAGEPAIVKNIAILRSRLGQTDEAISAWRKYASLDGVPTYEAVEAEALAQLPARDPGSDEVDQLVIRYPVQDTDRLVEQLVSDKRASQMPVAPSEIAEEGEPPPKAAYWLLDRPAVESDPDIQLDDIPQVLGELLLFGKQTDREARLEFSISDADSGSKKAVLADVAGELAGPPEKEETRIGSVSAVSEALTWRWRLPPDVPPQRRRELLQQQHRKVMLEVWPETSLHVLDGKKPAEVASDPAYRVRLLASILLLELASDANQRSFDFNELRDRLGLPQSSTPELEGPDAVMRISLWRLPLLDPATLSDKDLLGAFGRAVLKNHSVATQRFGLEVLNREQLGKEVSRQDVYRSLFAGCDDAELALEYVEAARKDAVSEGESSAEWLLAELSIRLSRLEVDHSNRIIQTIRARHMEEPGVAESLFQLLVSYGVITPDGRPAGETPRESVLAGADESPPAESGKIWTPDSQTKPSGEQKSQLWVPGME